jgi:hypothetical protein
MVPTHRSSPCRLVALAHVWSAVGVSSLLACSMAAAQSAADIRLSRYTTTSATPEAAQVDPLEAVVQLNLPSTNVQTVGECHLLPDEAASHMLRDPLCLRPRRSPE